MQLHAGREKRSLKTSQGHYKEENYQNKTEVERGNINKCAVREETIT